MFLKQKYTKSSITILIGITFGILITILYQQQTVAPVASGVVERKLYSNQDWHFSIEYPIEQERNVVVGENKFSSDWFSVLLRNDTYQISGFTVYAATTSFKTTQDLIDANGHTLLAWMATVDGDQIALVETRSPFSLGQGQDPATLEYGKTIAALYVKNGIEYKIMSEHIVHIDQEIDISAGSLNVISSFRVLD